MADDSRTLEIARSLYAWIQQDLTDGDRASQTVSRIQVTLNELLDAERLTSNPAGKIAGYTAQPDVKVALVNSFKQDEERLLRKLDEIASWPRMFADGKIVSGGWLEVDTRGFEVDKRWLAIARTKFEEAYMALNRSVFQPQRIALPEDAP